MVTANYSLFYQYGPAQATGPDARLPKGRHLTLLARSFGYSHVMLEDARTGYVATEDIAPAPPEPAPAKLPPSARAGRLKRPEPSWENPAGVPYMEPPMGLPELPNEPTPTFRY